MSCVIYLKGNGAFESILAWSMRGFLRWRLGWGFEIRVFAFRLIPGRASITWCYVDVVVQEA